MLFRSNLYASLVGEDKEADENLQEVENKEDDIEDVSKMEAGAEDEPVKKLARLMLFNGLERGASDIHIEPFEKLIRIRYRVDGTLE